MSMGWGNGDDGFSCANKVQEKIIKELDAENKKLKKEITDLRLDQLNKIIVLKEGNQRLAEQLDEQISLNRKLSEHKKS